MMTTLKSDLNSPSFTRIISSSNEIKPFLKVLETPGVYLKTCGGAFEAALRNTRAKTRAVFPTSSL